MKNSTILRDELSLLNENRSAVITELRKASQDLKDIQSDISKDGQTLADVRSDIVAETARLNENQSRAVLYKEELIKLGDELNSLRAVTENYKVKNSLEVKNHLGRLKEVEEKKAKLIEEIESLKMVHDKNYNVFSQSLSEMEKKVREARQEYIEYEKNLSSISLDIVLAKEEEKKITKERLKREDKIRIREKMVEMRDVGLTKKEEDLFAMSSDLKIIYGRMKELYYNVDPTIDIDKLITQPE